LPVGSSAPEVVAVLPKLIPEIDKLTFLTYRSYPGLEQRLGKDHPKKNEIFEKASQLRAIAGADLPYWESILVSSLSSDQFEDLVRESLRHDETAEERNRLEISASGLTLEGIERIKAGHADRSIALCSRFRTRDGSCLHIPMLDFRCPPSPTNLERVIFSLRGMGQTAGVVLLSGKSYHYYGFEPIDHEAWIKFSARSILLAPIIDVRYIAHRLIQGMSVLRISASADKPQIPRVVARLEPDPA
jgi:hypothetical protein